MEGVDTYEQGDQNLICLYSKEQTDHVAQGYDILYLSGKETTITEVTQTKAFTLHPYSPLRADCMNVFWPCRATGVSTCCALLTLVPRCSRYRADTVATLTSPPTTAESAILWHARLSASAAVTILPCPAAFTVTLPAVTHPVAYKQKIPKAIGSTQKHVNHL